MEKILQIVIHKYIFTICICIDDSARKHYSTPTSIPTQKYWNEMGKKTA